MFIADQIVYLELERTGCSHTIKLLRHLMPGRRAGKHNRLPPYLNDGKRFIVGNVRNPWVWYVSLWSLGCRGIGSLHDVLTRWTLRGHGLKRHPLRGWKDILNEFQKPITKWRHLYGDIDNPMLFRRWLEMILDPKRKYDLGDGYGHSPMSESAGFMTYRYAFLYWKEAASVMSRTDCGDFAGLTATDERENLLQAAIRTEYLEADLIASLEQFGLPISEVQKKWVYSARKTGASKRRWDIGHYYDTHTRELVHRREKLIVDKYGYVFPE